MADGPMKSMSDLLKLWDFMVKIGTKSRIILEQEPVLRLDHMLKNISINFVREVI